MERKSRFGEDGSGGNGVGAEKGPPGRAADIVFSYYKNSGPEGVLRAAAGGQEMAPSGEQVKARVMGSLPFCPAVIPPRR